MNRLASNLERGVVLLALGLRLWFAFTFTHSSLFTPVEGGHDRTIYHQAAQQVAHGQIWPAGSFAYLPLYPWALGALYAFTGPDLRAAAGLGIACDTLTVILLMLLARRLGARPGWPALAGLLYALYPPAIVYAALTMPTSLNILLVTALALGLAARPTPHGGAPTTRCSSRSVSGTAALGLLAGMAGLGYPALWPALLAIAAYRKSLIFLAVALLPILPVAIHNTRAEGHFTLLSTHGGFNFYMGNFEDATGYTMRVRNFRLSATAMMEDAHRAAEAEVGHSLTRAESSAWWSGQARQFMREHPGSAVSLLLRKFRLFWSGTEVDDLRMVEQSRVLDGRFTAPFWTCFGLISALGLFGLLRSDPSRSVRILVWGSILSIATLFITTRYRMPLVPILAAFGAAGLATLLRDFRTPSRMRGNALALLIAVALAAWPGGIPDLRATDHHNASVQLLAAGQIEAALAQATRGLTLNPASPELYHAQGGALFKLARYPEAATAFQHALSLNPGYASARYNLALTLARAGDQAQAITVLADDPNPDPQSQSLLQTLRRIQRSP